MKSLLYLRWTSAAIFAAAVFLSSPHSRGAVFSRDWKTPGDGLLTYDDVNRREWLDLTASRLSMFPGATREERFRNALSELVPGGLFDGFRVARGNDLIALAQSAGIDTASQENLAINELPTRTLINLVGISVSFQAGQIVDSIGKLDEIGIVGGLPFRFDGVLFVDPTSGAFGDAGLIVYPGAGSDLSTPQNTGVWLFRSIPEPSHFMLASIAVTTLHLRSRRSHRSRELSNLQF